MRAVASSSNAPRCNAARGIHNTVVYSWSERIARLLPNQSNTAVLSAMPVTTAMARDAYELRPATRAMTQKNWSVVICLPQRPGQRMRGAKRRRQVRTDQQRGLGDHLGLEAATGNHGHLREPGARRKTRARVDEVVDIAPAPASHAAGRRPLAAQK